MLAVVRSVAKAVSTFNRFQTLRFLEAILSPVGAWASTSGAHWFGVVHGLPRLATCTSICPVWLDTAWPSEWTRTANLQIWNIKFPHLRIVETRMLKSGKINIQIQIYVHAHIYIYILICIYLYMHVFIFIHIHMYIYIHKYIHIYMYIYMYIYINIMYISIYV